MIRQLWHWLIPPDDERLEEELWEAICRLHDLLAEAEREGHHFRPTARMAREMLRAVGRR